MAELRQSIAILGPGLLGGSLILRLAQLHDRDVRVWARRAEALTAVGGKCADIRCFTNIANAVEGADVVVLATPVNHMLGITTRLKNGGFLKEDAVITDVGSVKSDLVAGMNDLFRDGKVQFVGSHPMAGSEESGFEAASATLFEGAVSVITPTDKNSEAGVKTVTDLWNVVGARVIVLDPVEHDRVVARISHMPHAAAALVVTAALRSGQTAGAIAASGFRDTTRVASGPAEMWAGIMMANRVAILEVLGDLQAETDRFVSFLEKDDIAGLQKFLQEAKETRDQWRTTHLPKP